MRDIVVRSACSRMTGGTNQLEGDLLEWGVGALNELYGGSVTRSTLMSFDKCR